MSENEIQSRAVVVPPILEAYTLTIWNNDGTKLLREISYGTPVTVKVTNTGMDGGYTYDSDGEFLGFATSKNQTSPTYTSGEYIDIPSTGITLYLVSYEWDKGEYKPVKVEYNGKLLGFVSKGSPLTLNCKDKVMYDEVSINHTNMKRNPKNLIPLPYADSTLNWNEGTETWVANKSGITFVVYKDGTIVANGTATGNVGLLLFDKSKSVIKPNVTYTLSGMPDGMVVDGVVNSYMYVVVTKNGAWYKEYSVRSDKKVTSFTAEQDCEFGMNMWIRKGITVENLTFKPMINEGEDEEPFYCSDVIGRNPKNLIPFPYYNDSRTVNGITFTVNDDGTVTANGTPTVATAFEFSVKTVNLKANTSYILSGTPKGMNDNGNKFYLNLSLFKDGAVIKNHSDRGDGIVFTCDGDYVSSLTLWIGAGTTVDNITLKPMLNEGTKALPYYYYEEFAW